MRQYEMAELCFTAPAPIASDVYVDLQAAFTCGEEVVTVKGFYAGNNSYKVRFLPTQAGTYAYAVSGSAVDGCEGLEGKLCVEAAAEGKHGIVRAEGSHLRFIDGSYFFSFGTTIYALAHQDEALTELTMESLKNSPFNKVRMCVFPKHYDYNHNDPAHFAFCLKEGAKYEYKHLPPFGNEGINAENAKIWDTHHPDFAFWDEFEEKMARLDDMGIQVDLILFHPYDRWGFSYMSQEDNCNYLEYLVRRFSAIPNVWWSLSNEYDLCQNKKIEDWYEIEEKIASCDPYKHLLSNHNCFALYDFSRPNVTHCSLQKRSMTMTQEMIRKFGKPALYDECVYEGNLKQSWGALSGAEMMNRFWKVVTCGGYCTHGEVFLDDEIEDIDSAVLWWAKGGKLRGSSPARIAFLRSLCEEIGQPLDPSYEGFTYFMGMSNEEIQANRGRVVPFIQFMVDRLLDMSPSERDRHLDAEYDFAGHAGDDVFLHYYGTECRARVDIALPFDHSYKIEVIDAWNMTRETVMTGASGFVEVRLPGREYMAVLASKEA